MGISARIKKVRLSNKLTQKAFSEKVKMDNSQYGKVENGKLSPTISLVMDVCSIFDVSPDWLLFENGKMYRDPGKGNDVKNPPDVTVVDNNFLLDRLEKLVIENHELKKENEQLKNREYDDANRRDYPLPKTKIDIAAEVGDEK